MKKIIELILEVIMFIILIPALLIMWIWLDLSEGLDGK